MIYAVKWTRNTSEYLHTTYTAPGYPTITDLGRDATSRRERYMLYLPKHDECLRIQYFSGLGIAKIYAEYYVREFGLTYETEVEIVD